MAIKYSCGYCGVVSIGRLRGHHTRKSESINMRSFCLVACDSCQRGSFISFHLNSGYWHRFEGYQEDKVVIDFEELYEAAQFPKPDLKVPDFLPDVLKNTYLDAEFNFAAKRWKAAVQLYLQALEFACITIKSGVGETQAADESAEKIDLTRRINDLASDGSITDALKE
ncbi:hypothetical protein [Roseobacter weihaiensis]|uniref:hypothetical protein n=1 Tax=Roseobacter weihaiensis TaxID=2763262 RepID=UPI001D0A7C59|nr:hypothetical protein [Roseobacter sp. H9]